MTSLSQGGGERFGGLGQKTFTNTMKTKTKIICMENREQVMMFVGMKLKTLLHIFIF